MEVKTSKRLEGIGEYYFSQKLREIEEMNRAGNRVINLGIGSPDLPPHPEVIKILNEESTKPGVHAYQSYKGAAILRKAMQDWYLDWYGVVLDPESEILPLIGSKEGILHICMTYLNEGDEVLVPDPGYPTYISAVKLASGRPVPYQLLNENDYAPAFDELERMDLGKVKLMFVNYPHMPTGQSADKDLFEKIVSFAKANDILLVHDNPYSFILNETPLSILAVKDAKHHCIELNSLSKSHNMAGWRVGMMVGSKERIAEVLRFKSNMDSGMFLPVQLAAAKALSLGRNWFEELNTIYRLRREKIFELLRIMSCSFSAKQAGLFVWATVPGKYTSGYSFSDEVLHNCRVFITPGGIFGEAGNHYIRVSLCAAVETIDEAIGRVRHYFSGGTG